MFEGTCPVCGKPTKKLRTKTGKFYYGCSGYPACDFKSWDEPTGEKCPVCGGALVKTARGNVKCANKECSYRAPRPPRPAKPSAPEAPPAQA